MSTENIERLMTRGKIRPSIHLDAVILIPVDNSCGINTDSVKDGFFEIDNYRAITWKTDKYGDDSDYCDLNVCNITLCQYGESYRTTSQIMVDRSELLISASELERFGATRDTLEDEDLKHAPDYLDPSHEYYSNELAAAVKVWIHLYGEGQIKKSRSHKNQITAALVGKGFSNSAIERIATLVNPKKAGGAPSSGK
jgi:hypothetical protein